MYRLGCILDENSEAGRQRREAQRSAGESGEGWSAGGITGRGSAGSENRIPANWHDRLNVRSIAQPGTCGDKKDEQGSGGACHDAALMELRRVNVLVLLNCRPTDMLRVVLGVLAPKRMCQDVPDRGAHRKAMRDEHRTEH